MLIINYRIAGVNMNDRVEGYGMKKSQALLKMYKTLISGGTIDKNKFAKEIKVSTKTIERYVEDINLSFYEDNEANFNDVRVEYDKQLKKYILKSGENLFLTKEEILTLSKICLESRGLSKNQMDILLNKLVSNCCYSDRAYISEIIFSERSIYKEPRHKDNNLINKIWDLTKAIRENRKILINYTRLGGNGEVLEKTVCRKIRPYGLLFSEYYFYLIATIEWETGKTSTKYIPYRLDRIKSYQLLDELYKMDLTNKVEEGEIRKITHFMYMGDLEHIEFIFTGKSIEAVEDKLPDAEINQIATGEYLVRVKGYAHGLKMWLLSQGAAVKVLKPERFRDEMRDEVEKMWRGYSGSVLGKDT
ncbi:helix-turn-helix transcriptional regulator [Clostridium sp. DL1XJH146]